MSFYLQRLPADDSCNLFSSRFPGRFKLLWQSDTGATSGEFYQNPLHRQLPARACPTRLALHVETIPYHSGGDKSLACNPVWQPEWQIMKTLPRAIGTLLLILSATLVNASAMAQHRGHKHGHGHGPIVRVGFTYGFPIYASRYFPAPFYTFPGYAFPAPVYTYPPAVVRYSPSPVYVERTITPAESAPPQAQNDWYYCAGSQTYYPYTKECPGGWQRVPAQPASR